MLDQLHLSISTSPLFSLDQTNIFPSCHYVLAVAEHTMTDTSAATSTPLQGCTRCWLLVTAGDNSDFSSNFLKQKRKPRCITTAQPSLPAQPLPCRSATPISSCHQEAAGMTVETQLLKRTRFNPHHLPASTPHLHLHLLFPLQSPLFLLMRSGPLDHLLP
jgi:hypothetical protein